MMIKELKNEKKILKNFKLKMSTIEKLKKVADENETTMTKVIEYLINEKLS